MLTADEIELLQDRQVQESFLGLHSLSRNYRSTKSCKPCGQRRIPALEHAFRSYITAIRNNPIFKSALTRLFGTRVPNIRGLQ